MLWDCQHVINFRQNINDNIGQDFSFLKLVPNNMKSRILGYSFKGSDNFEFVFYMYVNRFIWLAKLRGMIPTLAPFKTYLKQNLLIQLKANILTCMELLDINNIWTD